MDSRFITGTVEEMDSQVRTNAVDLLALPDGWTLIERHNGPTHVFLEFQKAGRMGHRVTGIGNTVEEAMAFGRARMWAHDERERNREEW